MTGKFKVNKTLYQAGLGECVGLAVEYVADGINTVTILAKDKNGQLKYPGLWQINGDDIREWPRKQFGNFPEQYFVPVKALTKISSTTHIGG